MTEPADHELLAEYARTGAEAPFARLVARHLNLVHSAAWRYTGNDQQAEEITQAVFLILARKAGSLSKSVALAGWLYQTARLTAANALKAEQRRQHRETEAYMQAQENETDGAVWREIAPLLDDAMGKLGATDRTVLVLRFFERQTNAEVAAKLGLAEGAVQKRVLRALEKLRANFAKQGVTHTAQAIAGTVTQNAVLVAPAGLLLKVSMLAAKGTVAATSITALANGTVKTIAATTIQKTLITTALIAAVGTGIFEAKQQAAKARAEVRMNVDFGRGAFAWGNVSIPEVSEVYAALANVTVDLTGYGVTNSAYGITLFNTNNLTRAEAVRLLEQVLLEQAGIKIVHSDRNRVIFKLNSESPLLRRRFSDAPIMFLQITNNPHMAGEANPTNLMRFFRQKGIEILPPEWVYWEYHRHQLTVFAQRSKLDAIGQALPNLTPK